MTYEVKCAGSIAGYRTFQDISYYASNIFFLYFSGNTNRSNKSKTVFSSSVIGPHGK